MKAFNLVTVLSAADNSRLTARQFSFRLPVYVAAKLAALEALYPTKSRTQPVGEWLSPAIADVENSFLRVKGRSIGRDSESDEEIFKEVGQFSKYQAPARRVYSELEKELGNKNLPTLSFC